MERVLLIGNANSKWVMHYVRKMLEEGRELVLINSAQYELEEKKEFYRYYQENSVRVITVLDNNIYTRCLKCFALIGEDIEFDVCHIMMLNTYAGLIARLCERKCKSIVANFFGSDFYNTSTQERREQDMLLEIADSIITPVDKMQTEVKKIYPEYEEKIHTVYFESQVLHLLKDRHMRTESDEAIWQKEKVQGKVIIAAGYKRGEYQQHEFFIHAMESCPKEIRDKVFVVFMMTYGVKKEEYESKIRQILMEVTFSHVIIEEFFTDEEMAHFREKIDIFVNTVRTDAFNAALQESLFCQTVVMHGDWLKYPILDEEKAFVIKFKDVEQLRENLIDVILNMEIFKEKSNRNREVITKICNKRENVENWSKYYYSGQRDHNMVQVSPTIGYIADKLAGKYKRDILYKETMENWLKQRIRNNMPVSTFIEKKECARVIIYGAGTLGEMTYKELRTTGKELIVCDKNVESVEWFNEKIITPVELQYFNGDFMIITPVHIYQEIVDVNKKIFPSIKMASLFDIVSEGFTMVC